MLWLESSPRSRAALIILVIHIINCRQVLLAPPWFLSCPFMPAQIPNVTGACLQPCQSAFSGMCNSIHPPRVIKCPLFCEATACLLTTTPQCEWPSLSPKLLLHLTVSSFYPAVLVKAVSPLPTSLDRLLHGETLLVICTPLAPPHHES